MIKRAIDLGYAEYTIDQIIASDATVVRPFLQSRTVTIPAGSRISESSQLYTVE